MSKNEIIELIDELSERLEGPAEQLFELAVRSVLTSAVLTVIVTLAVLVAGIYTIRWTRINYLAVTEKSSRYSAGDGYAMLGVGSACLVITALVFLLVAVHQLLNVEFYAIKSLVPGL